MKNLILLVAILAATAANAQSAQDTVSPVNQNGNTLAVYSSQYGVIASGALGIRRISGGDFVQTGTNEFPGSNVYAKQFVETAGNLYAVTGSTLQLWNVATHTWVVETVVGSGTILSACAFGSNIYLFGTFPEQVLDFNCTTQTTTQMNVDITSPTLGVYSDGKLYGSYNDFDPSTSNMYIWNSASATTELVTDLPGSIGVAAIAKVGSDVYVLSMNSSIIHYELWKFSSNGWTNMYTFDGVNSDMNPSGMYVKDSSIYIYGWKCFIYDAKTGQMSHLVTPIEEEVQTINCLAISGDTVYVGGNFVFWMALKPTGVSFVPNSLEGFAVWPNPASDFLWISSALWTESRIFSLYNYEGKLLRQVRASENFQLMRENLPSGIYFLTSANGIGEMIETKKIVFY